MPGDFGNGRCPVTALDVAPRQRAQVRLPRLLAGLSQYRAIGLREHEYLHGPLPRWRQNARQRSEHLIDLVERSGLTGRGGAGFPAGVKMRAVTAGPGRTVVVANGAEGEPASRKDWLLLTRSPHLVLDGISLATTAVRASEAYLCVHGREHGLLARLERAIAEREAAGLDRVPVRLTAIPSPYVSSEQSAIVHFLNGGPAKPTFTPPRMHERGVKGRPTLVNNVETLAHLALIARHGDRWFRSVGLPTAPGSTLVTVGGAVARPGVLEIALGTPLGQVIAMAGGPTERLQAVLVGGYFGAWLPAAEAWRVPMCHGALKDAGGAMGAGVLVALPESSCALVETARVVRYLAGENAGQCGPCMFGLPALADELSDLAYVGAHTDVVERIGALLPLIEGRGACRHPDGVTQLVRSALWTFAADAARHDRQGPCAGVRRAPLLPAGPP